MMINLEDISRWVGTIVAIATPFITIMLWFIKKTHKLVTRLSYLEAWTKAQQIDIEHSKEERSLLLSGTLACLKGLQQQGCNGEVINCIIKMEAFIMEEAHKGKSRSAD